MKTSFDISVIIVSFNTKELLRACLSKVYASGLGKYKSEVIVVDNASEDGSAQMVGRDFPRAVLIRNSENLGFAAANNKGIRQSHGRYVLLLNSDTELYPDTLCTMIAYMDNNKDTGAATCKLILSDGTIDPACHRGFPTPWASFTYYSGLEKIFPKSRLFSGYHLGQKDKNTVHDVDVISGAFFLVRREVTDAVGLLDEDFFMYAEDIDWSFRIRQHGWRIVYNPMAVTLHRKKQSGRSHADKTKRLQTEELFYRNNKLFYAKHYARKYSPLLTMCIYGIVDLRIFLLRHFGV